MVRGSVGATACIACGAAGQPGDPTSHHRRGPKIIRFEADRGDITRTERSTLASATQPDQELIDQLFFGIAGPTADEVKVLDERYAKML